MAKHLLVTGASGFLGWEFCRQAAMGGWDVIGAVHMHTEVPVPTGVCRLALDLTATEAVAATLARLRPAAIVHLAAASDPNWCQQHVAESEIINVAATRQLATWCAAQDVPLIFASTDLVFDGRHAPYAETAAPAPVCLYGEQKARAETILLRDCPRAVICRLPLLFGTGGGGRKDPLGSLAQALREKRPVHLFTDEYRTPGSTVAVASGLLVALDAGRRLLHLGGAERVSRYDFGVRYAKWLGVPPDAIVPCRQLDAAMAAPRPPDVSFDSQLALSLGYRPLGLEEEFARCH